MEETEDEDRGNAVVKGVRGTTREGEENSSCPGRDLSIMKFRYAAPKTFQRPLGTPPLVVRVWGEKDGARGNEREQERGARSP